MKRYLFLLTTARLCLIVAIGAVLAAGLYAQQPGEIASRLAENSKKLRAYSWTMRTEVLVDGQSLKRPASNPEKTNQRCSATAKTDVWSVNR